MTHAVVLVSRDAELAARVRRALPATLPIELHCATCLERAPGAPAWLLILLDGDLLVEPAWQRRELPGGGPPSGLRLEWPGEGTPVLWLGARPGIAGLCERQPEVLKHIVDYLDRSEAPSKLAFVLHQHLAAAYLRRMRAPRPLRGAAPVPPPEQLQRQLNNALTGILGNAALALDAGRRLPAPLGKRLQRIAELAADMREALAQMPALPSMPPPASQPKAA